MQVDKTPIYAVRPMCQCPLFALLDHNPTLLHECSTKKVKCTCPKAIQMLKIITHSMCCRCGRQLLLQFSQSTLRPHTAFPFRLKVLCIHSDLLFQYVNFIRLLMQILLQRVVCSQQLALLLYCLYSKIKKKLADLDNNYH